MPKCIDCFNLLTTVVNEKKLKEMYDRMRATFIDKIDDLGVARIWWCDKAQLPHKFYTKKYYVYNMFKESCPFWIECKHLEIVVKEGKKECAECGKDIE